MADPLTDAEVATLAADFTDEIDRLTRGGPQLMTRDRVRLVFTAGYRVGMKHARQQIARSTRP